MQAFYSLGKYSNIKNLYKNTEKASICEFLQVVVHSHRNRPTLITLFKKHCPG